jgi:hypothetical protein
MFTKVAALVSAIGLFACSAVGVRESEEPKFTVAAKLGLVEVRQYNARIAAETVVTGDEMAARNAGFRRLASYIFGANHDHAKIAMTTPVAQDSTGSKIAMTAPVAQAQDGPGQFRIRFFMPSTYTLAMLPEPDDKDVKLVTVPPETLAVLQFSGTPTPDAVAARTGELVMALEGSAWRPAGAPVAWFFDPPWTVPGLRRNEVAIPVSPN